MNTVVKNMAGLAAAAFVAVTAQGALAADPVKLKFTLDWKFEGPLSIYLMADQKGYFKAEGLDITIDTGTGSAGAVNRVASGAYEAGITDLNSLIEFDVKNPAQAMKAVYMAYNHPPYAIIALKKSGIAKPADLKGKKLGAPGFDAARATFAAFAAKAGLAPDAVTWTTMDPPLREPMLARGDVDAISGFYFTSALNLEATGVKPEDLVVFNYSDAGVQLYGNAIIVSPKFAAEHPDAVKGLIRATIKATKEAIADPAAAVKYIKPRDPLANEGLELKRLNLAIANNLVTPDVKEDGLGAVRADRLAASIDELAAALKLPGKPKPDDVFDASFLPPAAERKLP
jgi:NitT/TauT family transport system substrate-binding protein